jgi:hypothetical protein
MKRNDSVLCVACSKPFDVGLLELVRWSGPLWCQSCITKADTEVKQAAQRVAKVGEVLGEV